MFYCSVTKFGPQTGAFGVYLGVTVHTFCYAISEHLLPEYIHMPKDMPSLKRLIVGWEQKTGFPMVVGAVDGTVFCRTLY